MAACFASWRHAAHLSRHKLFLRSCRRDVAASIVVLCSRQDQAALMADFFLRWQSNLAAARLRRRVSLLLDADDGSDATAYAALDVVDRYFAAEFGGLVDEGTAAYRTVIALLRSRHSKGWVRDGGQACIETVVEMFARRQTVSWLKICLQCWKCVVRDAAFAAVAGQAGREVVQVQKEIVLLGRDALVADTARDLAERELSRRDVEEFMKLRTLEGEIGVMRKDLDLTRKDVLPFLEQHWRSEPTTSSHVLERVDTVETSVVAEIRQDNSGMLHDEKQSSSRAGDACDASVTKSELARIRLLEDDLASLRRDLDSAWLAADVLTPRSYFANHSSPSLDTLPVEGATQRCLFAWRSPIARRSAMFCGSVTAGRSLARLFLHAWRSQTEIQSLYEALVAEAAVFELQRHCGSIFSIWQLFVVSQHCVRQCAASIGAWRLGCWWFKAWLRVAEGMALRVEDVDVGGCSRDSGVSRGSSHSNCSRSSSYEAGYCSGSGVSSSYVSMTIKQPPALPSAPLLTTTTGGMAESALILPSAAALPETSVSVLPTTHTTAHPSQDSIPPAADVPWAMWGVPRD
eukprot:TRINITY_DN20158_c0_g1_i1.p1 TRINITY_DN20158_c0_g1~~TRINITY_DN20158_c0_g1_i1.p1  ORF type:complete len:635 (-),score=121.07 TRINITY_DN20158_c0_g1_i1:187-1911(-)